MDSDGFMMKYKCRGVVGKKSEANMKIRGVTKSEDVYIGRLDPDTSEDNVMQHIKETAGVEVITCVKLKCRVPNCSSFKVTISDGESIKLYSSDIWPKYVECREFVTRSRSYCNNE